MRIVVLLLVLVPMLVLCGCVDIHQEMINTTTTKECSGCTIYSTPIHYDETPFHYTRCSIGSKNTSLTFKKNCTLLFKTIDFLTSKKYVHIVAYSEGNVTYIFKTKGNIIVEVGNRTIVGRNTVIFNCSGSHEFTIRWV